MSYFRSYSYKKPVITNITGYIFAGTNDGGVSKSINVTATTIQSFGAIVLDCGFCWSSTNALPTIADSVLSKGKFTKQAVESINLITSLNPSTTYYIRAYATNIAGIAYSSAIILTTADEYTTDPSVETISVSNITSTSVFVTGELLVEGSASITFIGFAWNKTGMLSELSTWNVEYNGVGEFSAEINSELLNNTTYYIQAYVENSIGVQVYGSQFSFTTLPDHVYELATVETTSPTSVSQTIAIVGVACSDAGSQTPNVGIVWNTDGSLNSFDNNSVRLGSGVGTWGITLAGLIPGQTYYYQAYATNEAGTVFGSQLSFTMQTAQVSHPHADILISSIISNRVTATAYAYGDLDSIISYGVYYNTTSNVDQSNNIGGFSSSVSGTVYSIQTTNYISSLSPATTYFSVAFVTTSSGTFYSEVTEFTTLSAAADLVSGILFDTKTASSVAIETGIVDFNNSGESIVSRYIYWNTSGVSTDTSGGTYEQSNILGTIINTISPGVGTFYFGVYAQSLGGHAARSFYTFPYTFTE